MQVLALITPAAGRTMEQIAPHLREEALHVWDRYRAGVCRQMYLMTGGRLGAVLLLEVESLEAARHEVGELPLVKTGDFVVECIALGPFVSWDGFFHPPAG